MEDQILKCKKCKKMKRELSLFRMTMISERPEDYEIKRAISENNLYFIQEYIKLGYLFNTQIGSSALNFAIYLEEMSIVKLLIIEGKNDYMAYIDSLVRLVLRNRKNDILEFIIFDGKYDLSTDDNKCIYSAIEMKNYEAVEILFWNHNIYKSVNRDQLLNKVWCYGDPPSLISMILYDSLSIKSPIFHFKAYHRDMMCLLRLLTERIAMALVELPTPLIIEIMEAAEKFVGFVPYHYKWNMVCAVKHPRWKK